MNSETKMLLLEVTAPVGVKREGELFVASCPALDVHAQGTSEGNAMENLKETMTLFLEACLEMHTLDKVLKDAGLHVAARASEKLVGPTLSVALTLTA